MLDEFFKLHALAEKTSNGRPIRGTCLVKENPSGDAKMVERFRSNLNDGGLNYGLVMA